MVRLVIAEKGLVCEERDVSLPQSEHKEPWFMRLNLGEEVPVIIHRDNIISDYDQIIDYVERTFTGDPPKTPRAMGMLLIHKDSRDLPLPWYCKGAAQTAPEEQWGYSPFPRAIQSQARPLQHEQPQNTL
ncbi:hypothetical protein P7K49_009766 [Saguinus oedipus]|uniref:GST N-terminal domain-containing protein n=1 Tax=Saguinus oedipus TaxID=9490 RepID=A0ABQ9VLH6_SAGOE|nr:hypothetical protein P7K49_009766 [Saguinus oedipus]